MYSILKYKDVKKYVLPLVGSFLSVILLNEIFGQLNSSLSEANMAFYLTSELFIMAAIMILASVYILNQLLDHFLSWHKYPGSRFILQLLLGTIFSLTSFNIAYSLIRADFALGPAMMNQVILINIYGAGIILPIFSLYFGYKFLKDWRKSEVESERLSKENTRSQLMSLRSHLDPHFLFNNLNILSSLMDKDISLSKDYLNKFAEVYRVILKTEHSDLTTLEEEIKLIESYIYLISIRFRNCVYFNFNINKASYKKALPPLSLQMLIENAIKHNRATLEQPITLNIFDKEDFLYVENNLQKKKYLDKEGAGSGLNNIQNRYEFFTDKTVKIMETSDKFTVVLPLIEIEYS